MSRLPERYTFLTFCWNRNARFRIASKTAIWIYYSFPSESLQHNLVVQQIGLMVSGLILRLEWVDLSL